MYLARLNPKYEDRGCPKNCRIFIAIFEETPPPSSILETERCGAHHQGLAKSIPPPEWKPRAAGYGIDTIGNIKILHQQHQKFLATNCDGVFELGPSFKRSYMTFKKFKDICQLPKNAPPSNLDIQELRQEYWRSLPTSEPVYGSDFDGTLTDKTMQIW